MTREIIVNSSPEETRVAVLEDGKVAEILIERSDDRSLVGNVYLGRVNRVLPGMQSAFVDVGLDRHAFLHVADVLEPPSDEEPVRGNDALGVEPEPGGDAGDDGSVADRIEPSPRAGRDEPRIEDLLRAGADILVQVTREPIAGKGARITTHVTLAGKHVVYMPLSDHLGVSKRIEDDTQREALRAILESARARIPGGVIARTDAVGHSAEEIEGELARLNARWQAIQAGLKASRAPACLHREPGIAVRVMRDALASEVARIVVDDARTHAEIVEYATHESPGLLAVVRRYEGSTPLFEAFSLEQEIDKALRDRVWLKSGGYLIINQMEALVAIDVNTGKFTGGKRLEDTVVQTNLEAAREVARQLRLRDLGGIVVVDFIDMEESENRRKVLREIEAAFARDRARTTVLGMSEFGLVEITRQRRKRSLERTLLQACPYCTGSGRIRSADTTVNHILRRIRAEAVGRDLQVRVHPDVAIRLRERETALRGCGDPLPVGLRIVEEAERHRETFELLGA